MHSWQFHRAQRAATIPVPERLAHRPVPTHAWPKRTTQQNGGSSPLDPESHHPLCFPPTPKLGPDVPQELCNVVWPEESYDINERDKTTGPTGCMPRGKGSRRSGGVDVLHTPSSGSL